MAGVMSDGFAYLDILFFAMVAAFIAFRLRGVLGRRTGHERQRPSSIGSGDQRQGAPVSAAEATPPTAAGNDGIADHKDPAVKQGLAELRLADPGFDLDHFLEGARAAFALIVESFAKGDKDALRPLLSDEVFSGFAGAIDARVKAGETMTSEVVALHSVDLAGAAMNGTRARLTLRFASAQINVTMDAQGGVVEGDPGTPEEIVDLWTFERDTRSRDPNWQLVETRSGE